MELDYKAIGARIRRFRNNLGYSQAKLSEIADVEPSYISHIERGATKFSLPTLVRIANALNVTPDEILCDSVNKSRAVFEREIERLLSDCTDDEVRVLAGTLRALKENLRKLK